MQQFRFGPRDVLAAALASVCLVLLPPGSSENCGRLVTGAFEICRWHPQLSFNAERNQDTVIAASDGLKQGMKKLLCLDQPCVLARLDQHRRMRGLRWGTSHWSLRGGCISGKGDDEPSSVQVEESLDEDQVGPSRITKER
jgi:hypothetical protein